MAKDEEKAAEAERIKAEDAEAADRVEDNAEPAAEPVNADDAPKAEEKAEEEPKKPQFRSDEDRRRRIAEKHRENRRREDDSGLEPIADDRERMLYGENVETRADRARKRAEESAEGDQGEGRGEQPTEAEARPEDAPETRKRVLKVNGREIEVSEEELVAAAQRGMASDNVLDEAKQLRAEQYQILDALRQARSDMTPAERQASEEAQPDAGENQPSNAELDQIIDRIQVGDPDEAKEALVKYGDMIEARIAERYGDIDRRIEDTIQSSQQRAERQRQMGAMLDDFGKDYPEFAGSQSMQTALAHEAAQTMRAEMNKIGVTDQALDDYARQNGVSPMVATSFAYQHYRGQGYELPEVGKVMRTAADGLREQLRIPAQERQQPAAEVPAEREERKRNLSAQPRRASAAPSDDTRERSREDRQRNALRKMKEARRRGVRA